MAEKKTTKKADKVEKTEKVEKKTTDFKDMSVAELKLEIQKVSIDVRTGKEKNTSLLKKLKKQVARIQTKKTN
jgi:ribosomal protein L29